ncbi:glycosyl hydrolase [Undibacterium sp. RuRC25W]|uniref:glycosyl hydrolase n=1 Tax=Undibacterium sp. RuRC25W TaxID=3413047 RepID=UPI003BF33E51
MKSVGLHKLVAIFLTGIVGMLCSHGTMAQQTTKTLQPASVKGLPSSMTLLSPYKYVRNNMDWNHQQLTTAVSGEVKPLLDVMPSDLRAITLAFATGECGDENWDGLEGEVFAKANINKLAQAGKWYIISTGGQAGAFTCATDAGLTQFIERYQSSHLIGFDFDIESSQSPQQIQQLVERIKTAQRHYPGLRFSFTLPTLAIKNKSALGAIGVTVMKAIRAAHLHDYYVNLMTMDYGVSSVEACVVGRDGRCDMGASAVQAALNLHTFWKVPLSHIELTPMIGGNDTVDEVFTLEDIKTITDFARQYHLAGVHFWSIDRDADCAPGPASPECNTYGKAGLLGFTTGFLQQLKH